MGARTSLVAALIASTLISRLARAEEPDSRVTTAAPVVSSAQPAAHRSPGMMVTGIVLTSLGTVALGFGAGALISSTTASSDGGYIGGVIYGGSATLAGLALVGVGIPLWVLGARAPAGSPAVAVSPNGARLIWRF